MSVLSYVSWPGTILWTTCVFYFPFFISWIYFRDSATLLRFSSLTCATTSHVFARPPLGEWQLPIFRWKDEYLAKAIPTGSSTYFAVSSSLVEQRHASTSPFPTSSRGVLSLLLAIAVKPLQLNGCVLAMKCAFASAIPEGTPRSNVWLVLQLRHVYVFSETVEGSASGFYMDSDASSLSGILSQKLVSLLQETRSRVAASSGWFSLTETSTESSIIVTTSPLWWLIEHTASFSLFFYSSSIVVDLLSNAFNVLLAATAHFDITKGLASTKDVWSVSDYSAL